MDGYIDEILSLTPESVEGYILCHLDDNSSNVANSLCGPLNALAVTPNLQELVESKGILKFWMYENVMSNGC